MEKRPRDPHTCASCADVKILLRCVGHCWHCNRNFEIKDPSSIDDLETDKHCPRCGDLGTRKLTIPRVQLLLTLGEARAAAEEGCELWQHWTRGRRMPQLDLTCTLVIHGSVTPSTPKNPCSKIFLYASWVGPHDTFAPTYGCLTGWAETSDIASRIITSRPFETDLRSDTSRKFIRQCLSTCLSTHERCRADLAPSTDSPELTDPQDVPSRLLDLGVEGGDVETMSLLVTGEADSSMRKLLSTLGFAILSYCWGGPNPMVLTRENLEALQRGINVASMPASIRDAVAVARAGGCRFLWIDALCILQDDGRDEADEIANMGQYYGAARLTICAASAAACSEGFLGPRDPPPPLFGPIRVPLLFANGVSAGTVLLVLVEEPETAAAEAAATGPPQPIARRGWTMQESLLSRRMLVYTTDVLHWACLSTTASNGGEVCVLRETPTENRVALVPGIYPFAWLLKWPTPEIWRFLVEEYSGRLLGLPDDKLLAISGAAERTVEICTERGEDPIYTAGCLVLGKSPASWVEGLLWVPERRNSTTRPVKYRAPSWSWAAVEGQCRFINVHEFGKIRNVGVVFSDTESYPQLGVASINLQYPDAPFGGVSGAVLRVRARVRKLVSMAGEPGMVDIVFDEDESAIMKLPTVDKDRPVFHTILVMRGDTATDHQRMKKAAKWGAMGPPEALLLPLVRVLWEENLMRGSIVRGLVVDAVKEGRHARIGTFAAYRYGPDLDVADKRYNWFLGEEKDVFLV
ncbi:heterokaryon incompatibility protein-domain-containing protein [Plectosphaerella plurivora]|uniref:Heterokaryon incompatibility protein-domain-containing protein n=1 Tax=Plectosphaerella plurivora TaxID=936078 RepID=A0A9P8UZY8_9PEZI|nr:heterokaryon incompatibility protein-domain-containing protein [Plectosphaerella plurivora]